MEGRVCEIDFLLHLGTTLPKVLHSGGQCPKLKLNPCHQKKGPGKVSWLGIDRLAWAAGDAVKIDAGRGA